jgi:hypothetical protein
VSLPDAPPPAPLAQRSPYGPPAPFGYALRDELGRAVARGTIRAGGYAVAALAVVVAVKLAPVALRAARDGLRRWWRARKIPVRVVAEPARIAAPSTRVAPPERPSAEVLSGVAVEVPREPFRPRPRPRIVRRPLSW